MTFYFISSFKCGFAESNHYTMTYNLFIHDVIGIYKQFVNITQKRMDFHNNYAQILMTPCIICNKVKKLNFFYFFLYLFLFFAIIELVFFCGLERTPTFLVPIINPPFADNSPHFSSLYKKDSIPYSVGKACFVHHKKIFGNG